MEEYLEEGAPAFFLEDARGGVDDAAVGRRRRQVVGRAARTQRRRLGLLNEKRSNSVLDR